MFYDTLKCKFEQGKTRLVMFYHTLNMILTPFDPTCTIKGNQKMKIMKNGCSHQISRAKNPVKLQNFGLWYPFFDEITSFDPFWPHFCPHRYLKGGQEMKIIKNGCSHQISRAKKHKIAKFWLMISIFDEITSFDPF